MPSISAHTSDVNTPEATETFSDIISITDSNIEDLTSTQLHELKLLRATTIALLEKNHSYRKQIVQLQRNS